MRGSEMADPPEWKSFGFEFKRGKLVFGEYTTQNRFLFVRDARGRIKAGLRVKHLPVIEITCRMLRELSDALRLGLGASRRTVQVHSAAAGVSVPKCVSRS